MLQQMPARHFFASAAAVAVAMTALAQDRVQLAAATLQETAAPPTAPSPSPAPTPGPAPQPESPAEISVPGLNMPPPPVELPEHARRDPNVVGRLDPRQLGVGPAPWGRAGGAFLSTLLRRMDTPIASRWAHIALRNLLLTRVEAPAAVHPVDWTAERAWLLLRMGEADAARMLVSGVDVDRFTPKMFQVGVQSALANADPSALCPLQAGIEEVEPQIYQLVDAMCAALAGEPETARSQIDSARRRGRTSEIDLALAQKVVGATANTGRAVTVEWEPVERLNAWRFGLAAATGMMPPERLIEDAPLQLRAWQAQAPLFAPADRLEAAQIAAGLGVFSSQALVDLHSLIYDSTGPDELPQTDAWQLRQAFVGGDLQTRLAAMRRLWSAAEGPLEREAVRAMLGRAATLVRPDPELQGDAVNLIASMLAAGYDREAARWAAVVDDMDDEYADEVWAMLALAAPEGVDVDRSAGRINDFIGRDDSLGRKRSALLVAGLAGLGHIDSATATRLNDRHNLRLDRRSSWTSMIDSAAQRGQGGTSLVLAGTGLQAPSFEALPPSHLFHAVAALRVTEQDFIARMIAAEALART